MVKKVLHLVFFASLVAKSGLALTVQPMNLDELMDGSRNIFVGVVESNVPEAMVGKIPSVTTTFKVEDAFKGGGETTITIKQFGRVGPQKKVDVFPGLPKFIVGERVLLFLPQPSPIGFVSPFGMGQGVFRVVGGKKGDGSNRIQNEFQNRTLASGTLSPQTKNSLSKFASTVKPGEELPLTLSQMKLLVQSRAGVQK